MRGSPHPRRLPLGPELREVAEELVAALDGTNVHRELLGEARRYATAFGGRRPEHYAILPRAVCALENAQSALAAEIEAGERAPLPAGARAALGSLLDLHGTAIMSSAEGARLAAAAAEYRRPGCRDHAR